MKKKFLCLLLVVAMMSCLLTPAMAYNLTAAANTLDGGMSHSVALGKDGEVYVWGDNASGQLGLGRSTSHRDTPTKVLGLSGVTSVAAGYNFTLALRYNGTVMAWGNGLYHTPTEVAGLENVVAISAGQINCLALTVKGAVYQWTFGGQPAQVPGLDNVVAISAGGTHCMALTRSGEVWTWGYNEKGQLGDGTTVDRTQPAKVKGLLDIVGIAAGTNHSLAVDFHGEVYAWGDNSYAQLGAEKSGSKPTPEKITSLRKVVQVAAGNGSSMARTADGQIYTWGYGEYGQIGNGKSEIAKATPVQPGRTGAAVYIACGTNHDLSITKNGDVYSWGRNNAGQLGTGKNGNSASPSRIEASVATETLYDTCVLNGASNWALEEIETLYPSGLIPPSLLGNYQETVTRGQLAHLLVCVYEQCRSTVNVRDEKTFRDIDDHPMKDSILKAYELGIINGTSKNTFSPDGKVTRQEAVTMICRFEGKMGNKTISTTAKNLSYYNDAAQIAEWAAPYVDYAYNQNIMQGAGGRFSPANPFTVEQSLLTIARLVKENNWRAR